MKNGAANGTWKNMSFRELKTASLPLAITCYRPTSAESAASAAVTVTLRRYSGIDSVSGLICSYGRLCVARLGTKDTEQVCPLCRRVWEMS